MTTVAKQRGFSIRDMLGLQAESKAKPSHRQYCMWTNCVVECSFDCGKCAKEAEEDQAMLATTTSRRKK